MLENIGKRRTPSARGGKCRMTHQHRSKQALGSLAMGIWHHPKWHCGLAKQGARDGEVQCRAWKGANGGAEVGRREALREQRAEAEGSH
eukprot:13924587-Alexandrium_andersonii.AAC.1